MATNRGGKQGDEPGLNPGPGRWSVAPKKVRQS